MPLAIRASSLMSGSVSVCRTGQLQSGDLGDVARQQAALQGRRGGPLLG